MLTVPAELRVHTGSILTTERPVQGLAFSAYILTAERGRFVLKLGARPQLIAELHEEHRVLAGLRETEGLLPQAVAHTIAGETGYFLYTCVEGENMLTALAAAPDNAARQHLAAEMGRALRRVHTWQPGFPRPANWLDDALSSIADRIARGELASPIDHQGPFSGQSAAAVLADLRRWRPTVTNDVVWSHLDYCVPNTLVRAGRVAGVIDWSRGRYADRRIDLASMAWSIGYNFRDQACVDSFLAAYGYAASAASLQPFEAIWILLG